MPTFSPSLLASALLLWLASPHPQANAGLLDSILGGSSSDSGSKSKDAGGNGVSEDNAKDYLLKFGYVEPGQLSASGPGGGFGNPLKAAVKKFQEFAHLPGTGILDVRTKKKMAQPRCGMQDVEMLTAGGSSGYRWNKAMVTYSIHNFSPDLSSSRQRDAIRRAYQTWSAVIPVDFQESNGQADINVVFASRSHGDPWPFDGRGGVLAHATMPTDGKLHFDEDENWVIGPDDADKIATSRYTDLYPVAIHEIGHTLGLSHSNVEDAIMAPFYQETVDSSGNYVMPRLKNDDIRAIQAIYGSKSGGRSPSSSSGGGRTSSGGRGRGGGSGRGGSGSGRTSSWGSDWDWGGSSSSSGRGRGGLFGSSDWDWPSSSHGSSRSRGRTSSLDSLFDKWLGRR